MKKGREKKHRIYAAFLCVCMLFSLPGISDIFPVVAAAEQAERFRNKNIIMAFAPLSEDIKEQTVFIGTNLDGLDLPKELTVYLLRESFEQKMKEQESTEYENTGETDNIEENSDTKNEDENNEEESVPFEEQEESDSELSPEELEENETAEEPYIVTMPEYYAGNVISVQTLENTQTEKQEETVTIDGVTWQSEPKYDGSTEGIYTFSAVLPEGYTLAEGVNLPEITVTVKESESSTDTVIQMLLDRIAALPEVEDYLSSEPDMDDEDAYAEWEEKLYAYAEEAFATWRDYETLTEEQQAQITVEELEKLEAWMEIAETLSDNNAVMLAAYSEHHGESDWQALTESDTTLTNGKYYLSGDIEMGTITINGGDVMLCLNGHKLQHDNTSGSVIVVGSGTFTLCDCQDHWGYTSSFDEDTKAYSCGITGQGGCITGGNGNNFQGGGVYVSVGANFNMNSGRITDCNVETGVHHDGGGVYVADGTFNMSGGFIDGNNAASGSVYIDGNTTFIMSGNAVIMDNTGTTCGGIQLAGNSAFNMHSGTIIGNKTSGNGAGIFLSQGTKFEMTGGVIEGNCTTSSGVNSAGGIYSVAATINLSGNCFIQHNIANKGTGGIRIHKTSSTASTFKVSGNISISDNYNTSENSNVSLNSDQIILLEGDLLNDIGVTYRPASGTFDYPVPVVIGTEISDLDWSHFSSDNKELKIVKDGNELKLYPLSTCDLSGLDLTAEGAELKPNFQTDITNYTATVGNDVEKVDITATLTGSTDGKTIKIKNETDNGIILPETDMASGVKKEVSLAVGLNTIEITVTSGSETKTYTIEITREAPSGYKVTLNGNGGSAGTNVTSYVPGLKVTLPTDWTKTGYEFAGWYDNENCTGTEVKEISATDTGDKEYWAKWTPQTYQVTFEYHGADGGDTIASKNVTYNSKYGTLPTSSRTGYTFKGWYTEENGQGNEVNAETTVTTATAHTLHAYWKDETAPDQPVLKDGVTLPTGWTNNQTTIPLKLYDGVGVTELWVSIDGKDYTKIDSFMPGTGSVTYDYAPVLEGEREPGKGHTYQFKAVDAAGNFAESDIFTVKLDQTKPMIGTITYDNAVHLNLWHWIIGRKSIVVHVPVTDIGSGVTEIRYTLTDKDGAGNLNASNAVTDTATVTNGEAKITIAADFRGTIAITCTDVAGNAADGVTVGKDAGGVIVEDNAPVITVLADRNLSDMQGTHTRPDGVAVSEDKYYNSAPALFVTVKDDTNNAITAGIATITYQVGNGEEQPVNVDTNALQTEITFTISANEIPTGITKITIKTTDNAGNPAERIITINVKGPEKQPEAKIDYRQEELIGLVPGGEYLIDGETYTADQEGHIPIEKGWLGNNISIIKKGNNSETSDSTAQNLSVPARPPKPTPAGVDVSTAGGKGKLTGLIAGTTYEISTDGGRTWQTQPQTATGSGEITGLDPGTYVVRVKAGTSNFASEKSETATIGAYKVTVTFMVDGTVYKKIPVDYGTALTDIPSTPGKDGEVGEWCIDAQGSSLAEFTNITTDMTVYAVYTTAYTVTLQSGTGYTLSAVNDSKSPVKEGGSFTFCFALKEGYKKGTNFAVMVDNAKVELTNDTYTITDIRADLIVKVEGVVKSDGGSSNLPGGGDHDNGDNGGDSEPTSAQPSADTPSTTLTPQPTTMTGTTLPVTEDESEGRKPEATQKSEEMHGPEEPEGTETPEPTEKSAETEQEQQTEGEGEQIIPATVDNGKIVISGKSVATGNVEGMTDTRTVLKLGNGAVIVTVVCAEQEYTAGVADTIAVANAVLTTEQIELVNNGETIEIRIDVKDISNQVPEQDKETIENGIKEYQKEMPGLTLGMYVDISMFIRVGEGDWNAITETRTPIEVIIGIPEQLQEKGRTYVIIRAHGGVPTLMNDMDDEPGTITVSTDLFSSYAIAYVQTDGAGADGGHKCGLCHICPTFLGLCCFVWLAIIILVMIVVIILLRKKKEEQDTQDAGQ